MTLMLHKIAAALSSPLSLLAGWLVARPRVMSISPARQYIRSIITTHEIEAGTCSSPSFTRIHCNFIIQILISLSCVIDRRR